MSPVPLAFDLDVMWLFTFLLPQFPCYDRLNSRIVRENKPFHPEAVFTGVFHHGNRKETRTVEGTFSSVPFLVFCQLLKTFKGYLSLIKQPKPPFFIGFRVTLPTIDQIVSQDCCFLS